jgi:HK97 gp10 family phage protein
MEINKNKVIRDSLRIAKSMSPIDSGNLRENAIKIVNRSKNGFTIRYSSSDAYYIDFVEYGTKYQDAQKFIEKTYIQIATYFASVGMKQRQIANSAKNSLNRDNELYRDNADYRRIVHRQSIFQHYQNDGRDSLYRKQGE